MYALGPLCLWKLARVTGPSMQVIFNSETKGDLKYSSLAAKFFAVQKACFAFSEIRTYCANKYPEVYMENFQMNKISNSQNHNNLYWTFVNSRKRTQWRVQLFMQLSKDSFRDRLVAIRTNIILGVNCLQGASLLLQSSLPQPISLPSPSLPFSAVHTESPSPVWKYTLHISVRASCSLWKCY